MTRTIFETAGGLPFFTRLAHAWHERCLADPIVSHAFSHGFHPQHSERLAAYWAEALGGPPAYSRTIGSETDVVRMHAGNGEHPEMDAAAQACFALALTDVGVRAGDALATTLREYFAWATGTMSAYPRSADDVPDGLRVAQWGWDGPLAG